MHAYGKNKNVRKRKHIRGIENIFPVLLNPHVYSSDLIDDFYNICP